MRRALIYLLVLLTLVLCPLAAGAQTQSVDLPITLDLPLIRAFLIQQVYPKPGDRALVMDQDQGCTRIELWEPVLSLADGLMKLDTRVKVRAGVVILGNCLQPVEWEGRLELMQGIWVDDEWKLRVTTQSSRILDPEGEPTLVSRIIWNLIQNNVHAYLDQFSINLAPPLDDLRIQLPLLFKPGMQEKVEAWLDTLRVDKVEVGSLAVKVLARMEVETPQAAPAEAAPPALPSPDEVAAFIDYWQAWDAYLVREMLTLSGKPLSSAERRELLLTLLEMRHGFVAALSERATGRDLVREQFMRTWRELAPIFRRHLVGQDSPSLFNYLAFFTASDALLVFDRLGPSLGLDISREGLMRLAHLLAQGPSAPSLDYTYQVDPGLRELLGLGPPLAQDGPAWPEEELILDTITEFDLGLLLRLLGPSPAWAATGGDSRVELIRQWLYEGGDLDSYLEKVRDLLRDSAAAIIEEKGLGQSHRDFFHQLNQATGWQESCWRQFIAKGGKLTYLRSYNGTSVGIMQINERVWRGMYQMENLRWDIAYNARAGAEILLMYLKRYALGRVAGAELTPATLAGAVYAMYNGGPSQFSKFLSRHKRDRLYLSDRLFAEKYAWVLAGDWRRAGVCLGAP